MTAAATSIIPGVPTRPISRELIRHPPAARAALQRPLQGLLARLIGHSGAQALQPLADDIEILVLVEWIEGHPQAKALRERDLLLHRLPGMDLVADVLGLEV